MARFEAAGAGQSWVGSGPALPHVQDGRRRTRCPQTCSAGARERAVVAVAEPGQWGHDDPSQPAVAACGRDVELQGEAALFRGGHIALVSEHELLLGGAACTGRRGGGRRCCCQAGRGMGPCCCGWGAHRDLQAQPALLRAGCGGARTIPTRGASPPLLPRSRRKCAAGCWQSAGACAAPGRSRRCHPPPPQNTHTHTHTRSHGP